MSMFDCIIIDEVHERSESIDTCIALLAKMKEMGLKIPKIILSSATIDLRVLEPFKKAGCRIIEVKSTVKSPFSRTIHYPDVPCHKGCPLCLHLSHTIYAPNVIKYVLSNQEKFWPKSCSKDDQLLVFMPSTQDVMTMVDDLAKENIRAYPLFSGQDGHLQSNFLANGSVFVSTNIAETSLTFPRLKVVIDLGKVQRPRLLNELDGSILPAPLMETVDASISTLKQRLGRVGRTCDGHYVALYQRLSLSPPRPKHIVAGLELNPPESLKFSIAKQLRCTSDVLLNFPSGRIIIEPLDEAYFKFPELGSKAMADAFFQSLKLNCSEDILLLAAVHMKLPPKSLMNLVSAGKGLSLPPPPPQSASVSGHYESYGDISVLLKIMRQINVFVPVGPGVSGKQISQSITTWCGQQGLMNFRKSLMRAHFEFIKMRNHYCPSRPPPGCDHSKMHPIFIRVKGKSCFDTVLSNGQVRRWNGFLFGRKNSDGSPDMNCKENYDITVLTRSSEDSQIIQALAYGYPNQFFIHCSVLDGPVNSFSRVTDRGDGGDSATQPMKTFYTIHSKSTMSKLKQKPVALFALNSLMFGQEMRGAEVPFRLAVLNIVQCCTINMFPCTGNIERYIYLHPHDSNLGCLVQNKGDQRYAHITGSPQIAITSELALRKSLRVIEREVTLTEGYCAAVLQKLFEEKSEQLKSSKSVFFPLVFLWKNFTGRRQHLDVFQEHILHWQRQFTKPQSIVLELPDHFMSVDRYRRASSEHFNSKDEYASFQKRLHHVTSESLSEEEIFELTSGMSATRESRMEAVCRIAVRTFDCKVVGGFVRDWIVNGERKYPPPCIAPQDWVTEYNPPLHGWIKWDFAEGLEVVPKDLDIELSMTLAFDVNRFISAVKDLRIEVDYYQHIPQRHIFLFDKKRGPFTADFIEPHFAILHTWGDFDVNCLAVSPYEDMIGLKMDYTTSAGSEKKLSVDGVISNCRQKQLVPMQDIHVDLLADRAAKMRKRGWIILPTINYVPETKDFAASKISNRDPRFKHYETMFRRGGATLDRMYLLRNPKIDLLYDALKQRYICTTGGNINERIPFVECTGFSEQHPQFGRAVNDCDLFHGEQGYFGAGAYFADDPKLSLDYSDGTVFVCDVILGNIYDEHFRNPIHHRLGPEFRAPHGYDSVKGRVGDRQTEYIVYRYGQARPKYLLCFSR